MVIGMLKNYDSDYKDEFTRVDGSFRRSPVAQLSSDNMAGGASPCLALLLSLSDLWLSVKTLETLRFAS